MSERGSKIDALNAALRERMEQWAMLGDTLRGLRDRQQRRASQPRPVALLVSDVPTPATLFVPDNVLVPAGFEEELGSGIEPVSAEEGWSTITVAETATEAMNRLLELANDLPAPMAVRTEEVEDHLEVDAELLPTLIAEAEELTEEIVAGLEVWAGGNESGLPELRRQVHTLKGAIGMAGGKRTRGLLHDMETAIEAIEAGKEGAISQAELATTFAEVQRRMALLLDPDRGGSRTGPVVAKVSFVRVDATLVDYLTTENTEARLASAALDGQVRNQRMNMRDMAENAQSLSRLLRDLEMYAESQIQSHRSRLAPGEEFDPLELDQYTHLHEVTRSLNELMADTFDLQRDVNRSLAEQETWLTQQSRAISEVQMGLHKTRLTPLDDLESRLYRVAWSTGTELGTPNSFSLDGGRLELDRVLLDRITAPLEHLLRNAVDHGLENPAERLAAGKTADGHIRVAVRQEAGRISVRVEDDGGGLRVEKVRQRAVERGLWPARQSMSDSDAADMICQPGFSTAAAVSQISGRGVGMDVVRSSVLALGGRFEVVSKEGRGMSVTIHLPTMVATASVMVVNAGGERLAIPVNLVDDVGLHSHQELALALERGKWTLADGTEIPLARLSTLFGLPTLPPTGRSGYLVLLQEGARRVAVEVDALAEIMEAPLRPAGLLWAGLNGVAGTTVLPDGSAAFLIDPLRATWATPAEIQLPTHRLRPTVLVVDDSITVRKASVRFLEQHGYTAITAKDGQEALEMLTRGTRPMAVLLDVEMPRMNGFQCLQSIRENERLHDLPVIMITSRTAVKHRRRAAELGILGYLGKPFNEDELDALLRPLRDLIPALLPSA
jgi:chemosensory pili system protein ChpA (sensor histidine kinase/response regulator)